MKAFICLILLLGLTLQNDELAEVLFLNLLKLIKIDRLIKQILVVH